MRARAEAYGWAALTGTAAGFAALACQDAAAAGRTGWTVLFAGFTGCAVPVFYATQWRELRG